MKNNIRQCEWRKMGDGNGGWIVMMGYQEQLLKWAKNDKPILAQNQKSHHHHFHFAQLLICSPTLCYFWKSMKPHLACTQRELEKPVNK